MLQNLENLISEIRQCKICEDNLPLGANPVLIAKPTAKILIVGQAPSVAVHKSGVPWDDPSGDRLRNWIGFSKTEFYDEDKIAIIPIGFCYPGKGKTGDLPPMKECMENWGNKLFSKLKNIKLTLLIGQYAQQEFLKKRRYKTLTETVYNWNDYLPNFFPLPHPSPRNTYWLQKNLWFDNEVVPELQKLVSKFR